MAKTSGFAAENSLIIPETNLTSMGNEELADFAVKHALKLGATYAEARWESHSQNSFMLRNSVPQVCGFDEYEGIGIRIISHGASQFCSTNRVDQPHVAKAVGDAMRAAVANAKLVREPMLISEEKAVKAKWEVKAKRKIENVGVDEKAKLISEVDKILATQKFKVPSRYVYLCDSNNEAYFTNSDGSRITSSVPRIELLIDFMVQHESQTMQRYLPLLSASGYEVFKKWDLEHKLAEEVKGIGKVLSEGVSAPDGPTTVVCSPEIIGLAVHESIGHPFEADRLFSREAAQAGETFLQQGDIGKRIGNELPTVVDDPTVPDSVGYYMYDDEGVKARRKTLVEKGKINELLLDRDTAYRMGTKSNGSSRASSFECEPLIRMSNTFLLPGDLSEEEIFDVKKGVYMKSYTEWCIDDTRSHQRYVSCEAYLIENGEVSKPVKRAVLECTTRKLWTSIDALGNKLDFQASVCGKGDPLQDMPISYGGPLTRLKQVRLGV